MTNPYDRTDPTRRDAWDAGYACATEKELDAIDANLSARASAEMLGEVVYDGNREALADALLALRTLRDSLTWYKLANEGLKNAAATLQSERDALKLELDAIRAALHTTAPTLEDKQVSEPRSAEEVACLRALWSDGECPGRVYFLGDVVAICDSHEALRAERDALKLRVDGMRPVVEAAKAFIESWRKCRCGSFGGHNDECAVPLAVHALTAWVLAAPTLEDKP